MYIMVQEELKDRQLWYEADLSPTLLLGFRHIIHQMKSSQFSLSPLILKILNILRFFEKWISIFFFHLFFLAKDFSLDIVYWILNFFRDVKNILLEGTVSQILYSGSSFYFI